MHCLHWISIQKQSNSFLYKHVTNTTIELLMIPQCGHLIFILPHHRYFVKASKVY